VNALVYTRDGLVEQVTYGDALDPEGGTRTPTVSFTTYDDRRRPIRMTTTRTPNAHGELPGERPLADVTAPHDQMLVWDLADNLIAIEDLRDPTEWPDGYRPQSVHVVHDSLYRVAGAEYEYTGDDGARVAADEGTDYRTELAATRPSDPMRTDPAPMATTAPEGRMVSMTWEYDWLGNMQEWTDDAGAFYERSLGDIVNGADTTTSSEVRRPGALYIASNLPSSPDPLGPADQGGWVEVRYGQDGNVLSMTVHAQCASPAINDLLLEPRTGEPEAVALSSTWSCASEQHYSYVWDEVNRIHEARRYDRDRTGGAASWSLAVQQRYLYDSANQRTLKSTTSRGEEGSDTRVALYVYPGDFERRGLVTGFGQTGPEYMVVPGETETQYVVGGARIVWRSARDGEGVDRDQRITIGLTDLIQSTTAVIDLATGEMVETGSYYANGARETYRASENGDRVAPEPMGFTGKEADEEVGLTYFGQRYLMAHLGRWASPDPLQTHAVGGGEAINGYHYVAGNVLQARDQLGLTLFAATWERTSLGLEAAPTTGADAVAARDFMRTMVYDYNMKLADLAQLEGDGRLAGWLRERAIVESNAIDVDEATGTITVRDVYPEARSRPVDPRFATIGIPVAPPSPESGIYSALRRASESSDAMGFGFYAGLPDHTGGVTSWQRRARDIEGVVISSSPTLSTEFGARGGPGGRAERMRAAGIHEFILHIDTILMGGEPRHGSYLHGGSEGFEDNWHDVAAHTIDVLITGGTNLPHDGDRGSGSAWAFENYTPHSTWAGSAALPELPATSAGSGPAEGAASPE
jgi:RHS repeat-associated protein